MRIEIEALRIAIRWVSLYTDMKFYSKLLCEKDIKEQFIVKNCWDDHFWMGKGKLVLVMLPRL
jgi:hypothetical protein